MSVNNTMDEVIGWTLLCKMKYNKEWIHHHNYIYCVDFSWLSIQQITYHINQKLLMGCIWP